jgi:hypothetical protein
MNERIDLYGKLEGIPQGPKMQALRTDRERAFAFAYATGICETAADAAKLAGYGRPYRKSAYQVIHKPRVTEAIEEVSRERFRNLVPMVISAAERVLRDPSHKDHGRLISSLLGRMGYSEKTSLDVNVSGAVVVNHVDAAVDDLRRLKALNVPHEKLLEVFGFSGLERYEQLLLERDSKTKVIEHQPESPDVPARPMEAVQ